MDSQVVFTLDITPRLKIVHHGSHESENCHFLKIPKIKKFPMVIKQNLGPNLDKGDK
jgi:hypothetical protein